MHSIDSNAMSNDLKKCSDLDGSMEKVKNARGY